MKTTQTLRLQNSPETSLLIGYLASQQRLAYNQAAEILNQTPNLPKRAKKGSGHGLKKRITAWRRISPVTSQGPYHIHQQGSEAAWAANELANGLLKIARADRRKEGPKRRTLRFKSRKSSSGTLNIQGSQFINVSGPNTFSIAGVPNHIPETKDAQACLRKSKKRRAEKKRKFNRHAIERLERSQPKYMCLEDKSLKNLTKRSKGKGQKKKANLNQKFAQAALGELAHILTNQRGKRETAVLLVPEAESSKTCPICGYQDRKDRKNRENQSIFQCQNCLWNGNADRSAALILRNRGYVQTTERLLGFAPPAQAAPADHPQQSRRNSPSSPMSKITPS